MLKFKLNVAERKTLAKRMEELTGIHPYYTKAPLYSYDIGSYTIDRNGNLLVEPENADAELLTTLLNEGLVRGGESIESTDDQMENTEPTDHLEEDPVTEDTEAETEVLDEQESEDESTTEGNEPAEAESEEASEPDNAAEDEPDAEEPESEEQSEAEDQPEACIPGQPAQWCHSPQPGQPSLQPRQAHRQGDWRTLSCGRGAGREAEGR